MQRQMVSMYLWMDLMLCNIQSSYFDNFDNILLQSVDAILVGCYKWAAVENAKYLGVRYSGNLDIKTVLKGLEPKIKFIFLHLSVIHLQTTGLIHRDLN